LSQTIYNSIGKVATAYDEFGNYTQYDYDETGNLWRSEGLNESWVGTASNVFAWTGTASLYAAVAVWAWSASGGGTMDIAVQYTGKENLFLHFQYGSNGIWKEAVGYFGQTMKIVNVSAGDLAATQLTGIPVLFPKAIFDATNAHNCLTAVIGAFSRGWGW
jgi:YD repeat-containing protein